MEPNKPTKPTCSTCPYFVVGPGSLMDWEAGERFYIQGACRRRAPDAMAGFVQVSGQDWCGEHPDFSKYLEALKVPELNPTPTAIQLTKEDEGSWWLTRGGWKAQIKAVYETLSQVHPVMLSEAQHWVPGEGDKYAYHLVDGKLYWESRKESPYDLMERTNPR